jgi:hypothetical protein
MTKFLKNIDPKQIYIHAMGFFYVEQILGNLNLDPQSMADIGQCPVVLSSLNSELFLKCIICIETSRVPRGHHLDELFKLVSPTMRKRIQQIWDAEVVPFRAKMWDQIDAATTGRRVPRDLPTALRGASKTFEKIRYSYEGNIQNVEFFVGDLPRILRRVIVELRPDFLGLRRRFSEVRPLDLGPLQTNEKDQPLSKNG